MSTLKPENLLVNIIGHCNIKDDLGNILLDKTNAVHPQNFARIFARALSNESNYYINRIAFGNGGTIVDAAFTITYRTPNDGQPPDISTWDSRLYHETFSKIVDAGRTILNPSLGIDPGSADINTGVRLGGGSVPSSDPQSIPHVSGPGIRSVELGLTSQVVITATLNADEPTSQYLSDSFTASQNTTTTFTFDEIGLYTTGLQAIASGGYQYISVGNKLSTDDTTLVPNTAYSFRVSIDGGTPILITFTTPVSGSGINGEILYGDLCQAINTGSTLWGLTGINPLPGNAEMTITDKTNGVFESITGAVTYGFLTITSPTSGSNSTVLLDNPIWTTHETLVFLTQLNAPLGSSLVASVPGITAGVPNAPTVPSTERERLLTHLIFSPVLKASDRNLIITYTITVSVARTPG